LKYRNGQCQQGHHQINKHVQLWARNAFDEWRIFCGFDIEKSILDFLESEMIVKNLVNMSLFVLQVAKKINTMYPPPSR
jgi:hypothetical protein